LLCCVFWFGLVAFGCWQCWQGRPGHYPTARHNTCRPPCAETQAEGDCDAFGPADIDAAFDAVRTLKHHQPLTLELRGTRLTLEAYPAGHMVGGSIWLVETGGEVVVYGPHSNHMKERCVVAGQQLSLTSSETAAAALLGQVLHPLN
jgi:hypothetical protein